MKDNRNRRNRELTQSDAQQRFEDAVRRIAATTSRPDKLALAFDLLRAGLADAPEGDVRAEQVADKAVANLVELAKRLWGRSG